MPPHRDNSSSVVPPTPSPAHSCSTSQISPQLEEPLASGQFVGIDDSDSDDDLSLVLGAITTIPIPQNPTDVKILRRQAKAKHKTAIQKYNLAEADFREAVLKAKLCRLRAQRAKDVLDATSVYAHHVSSTIQQSNYKDVCSKVTTVTDSGQHGTIVKHFVDIPGGSLAITLD